MRRSLLVRLLALSLAVAACAIGATAWLTGRNTSRQLRGELERTLEGDAAIYQALLGFADGQPTWDGVDKLVNQLAGKTGQRIALTTPDGRLLADSASTGPDRPRLPRTPAAVVDPFNPALNLLPAGTAASAASGKVVGDGLSAKEHDERVALARKAAGCFIRSGVPARVTDDPLSTPAVVWDKAPQPVVVSCVPTELNTPPAKEMTINAAIKELTAECYEAARQNGVAPNTPQPVSGTPFDKAVADCEAKAERAVRDPYVADPALLYLGSGADRYEASWDPGEPRTVGTVVAVLLATVAVTVLAGRRLARPIHALTAAVQRMEAGDRTARVPVKGSRQDEVGRLAHAFNAMAVSMEENERQRQAMVSDIAHELRNPLTNVRGYLEGAQDGLVPLDEALIASLLEESTLLGRLVDDLQDLALADAGRLHLHPEPLDVADLVEQVAAAHRAAAAVAGVTITADVSGPVRIEGDPGRLRQALGNLVGNALRYTPAGGSVMLSAAADGASATIAIEDTGTGIAAEHLPHIFERFYRADASRSRETGGSGLGLAITKHLIEAHGGTIEASSVEGAGSTFTVRLPLAADPPS
ncbi:MAG: ATP-binding protein [Actinomycetota bacterium]|jgi:two-component system, OmpR family, sensor histidine kinase BaeS